MSSDLRYEMEALRQTAFGTKYQNIRQGLEKRGDEERKREFRELEDAFFYLVARIVASQNQDGWWNVDQKYQRVITAHAVRHLHKIGLSLNSRWNLKDNPPVSGNLFRATEQLVRYFHDPEPDRHARWDTDVWDDCYIMLALLEVQPDFQDAEVQSWNLDLKNLLGYRINKSLQWLEDQFDLNGFNQKVASAAWYGPGFYAAAIELFDHTYVKTYLPDAANHVNTLAAAAGRMLQQRLDGGATPEWEERFAWHAGQILVTWKEKHEDHLALKALDPLMAQLFEELKMRQSAFEAWGDKGQLTDDEDEVYYTVRALAACYVNVKEDEFLDCQIIEATHKFLLALSRKYDGLLLNPKASINALEAFQKLFDFRLRNSFPNVLLLLTARLNGLGLLDNFLNPPGSDVRMLKEIRACARLRLEEEGRSGLELLGVNDRLYQSLRGRDEFLKEFTGDRNEVLNEDKRADILKELRRFLSSTLTETRSKSSRRLIKDLWHTDGFLSFIPLIEHLSDLEQDRAFYKYYRDHLNHEVLLFLLGTYIYYNCQTFREKINDEISRIWEGRKISYKPGDLSCEFLFRWKLISTFHDIGYLFEVDPFEDKFTGLVRTKEELLTKSFSVVDKFRQDFLFDYLTQYIKVPAARNLSKEEAESATEREVRGLTEEISRLLKPYPGTIESEKDLFRLSTGAGAYSSAFKLISQYVKPGHIADQLIEEYFNLCRSMWVVKEAQRDVTMLQRGQFLDHGIMSALILLKAADVQRHYLRELTDEDFSGTLYAYPQMREILENPKTKAHLNVSQFFIRFSHVAGAIALHNISPHQYTQEQCVYFDQKAGTSLEKAFYTEPKNAPGRYIISLDENPLSYLTALADTLQDWDRHSFRRPSFEEESGDPLSSSEVAIDFSHDGKINIKPLTDGARLKYLSLTGPKAMDQYLLNWREHLTIAS